MDFRRVKNMKERHALVQKFLENRKVLKDHFIEEKINKQQFQKYIAQPLAQPLKTHLDVQQDKLIKEMKDEQKAMGEKQDAIVKAIEDIPPALPPPTLPTTALPSHEEISINLDFGLDDEDKDRLATNGLPFPSEVYLDYTMGTTSIADIRVEINKLDKLNQSLRGRMNTKDAARKEEARREYDAMKRYKDSLERLHRGLKTFNPTTTGKGHKTKNPCKLTSDSMFGDLYIDPNKLVSMKLEAYKDGKKVISRKIDSDFLELLTKRFNSKKKYSDKTLDTWERLIQLSGLTPNKKYKPKPSKPSTEIKYYKTPEELCERLQLLLSSKSAGNDSTSVDNEIVEIVDKLITDGVLSKEEYKLYNNIKWKQ